MRKSCFIGMVLLVFFVSINSCKSGDEPQGEISPKYKLKVLTSFLPIYVFTLNVVKGASDVEVDVLIPPELVGPHDYEPTPSDLKKIDDANIFIVNGLGIETFLRKVKTVKPDVEIVEASHGIQTLPDILPGRDHTDDGHGHHHEGINPHVWVSPYLAARMVHNIAEALAGIDLKNASIYRENAAKYMAELEKLGDEFKNSLLFVQKRKVVTIHNAFDYLARDVGFEVVAVLRVDVRSEPRAAELARIAEIIKTGGVPGIFMEPQFSSKLAEVLSKETGAAIYVLDPVATGKSSPDLYVDVMLENLESLKAALGDDL